MTLSLLGHSVIDAAREIERRLVGLARELERRPDDPRTLAAYGEAPEEAKAREVWDADRRAELVLAGLGLQRVARGRGLACLSGGELSRLALAAVLMRRPRALLLDEPSNHLDDEALTFLEEHLRGVSGVVVVASHDRVFLDAVCTAVLDLDPARNGGLGGAARGTDALYGGTCSDYLRAKRAKRAERARWEQEWREQQGEISRLKTAVSKTAREVSRSRPVPRTRVGPGPSRSGPPGRLRHGESASHGAQRRRQVHPSRRPCRSSRTTGGSGVPAPWAARGTPGAGRLVPGPILERTRNLRRGAGERPDGPSLGELGLIASRDQGRPVGDLSTGQRRRLALAILVASSPHVLLLDEPTNHISLALAQELEEALGSASGAVVVATHDRWLRRRWAGSEMRLVAGRRSAPDTVRERKDVLHVRLP